MWLSLKKSIKNLNVQLVAEGRQPIFPTLKEDDDHADEVEETVTPKELRKALEVLKNGYFQKLCITSKWPWGRQLKE